MLNYDWNTIIQDNRTKHETNYSESQFITHITENNDVVGDDNNEKMDESNDVTIAEFN
jgi:hypothetical protein